MSEAIEQFGPTYNVESASLRKFRKSARNGLASLSAGDRQAYGAAVEAVILASHAAALKREAVAPKANCASGTFHSEGAAIGKAIRSQHHAALMAYPAKERRERTPDQWRAMYAEAMSGKPIYSRVTGQQLNAA